MQYRVAQPGEVLGAGGKVLNIVDLSDVYMTFFLPTDGPAASRSAPRCGSCSTRRRNTSFPAQVTFVADVAQFTPKTVETAEERQKLMFRIKAQIAPDLLKKYIRKVKTGLPGVAYVQLDPASRGRPICRSSCRNDTRAASATRPPVAQPAGRRPALRQDPRARRRRRSTSRPAAWSG